MFNELITLLLDLLVTKKAAMADNIPEAEISQRQPDWAVRSEAACCVTGLITNISLLWLRSCLDVCHMGWRSRAAAAAPVSSTLTEHARRACRPKCKKRNCVGDATRRVSEGAPHFYSLVPLDGGLELPNWNAHLVHFRIRCGQPVHSRRMDGSHHHRGRTRLSTSPAE